MLSFLSLVKRVFAPSFGLRTGLRQNVSWVAQMCHLLPAMQRPWCVSDASLCVVCTALKVHDSFDGQPAQQRSEQTAVSGELKHAGHQIHGIGMPPTSWRFGVAERTFACSCRILFAFSGWRLDVCRRFHRQCIEVRSLPKKAMPKIAKRP